MAELQLKPGQGADGGSVIFRTGRPADGARLGLPEGKPGAFLFQIDEGSRTREVLRIEAGGRFFVNGEYVTDSLQVFDALSSWLSASTVEHVRTDVDATAELTRLREGLRRIIDRDGDEYGFRRQLVKLLDEVAG